MAGPPAASTSARSSAPGAQAPGADDPAPIPPEQDPQRDIKEFSVYVFNDAQQTWDAIFDRRTARRTTAPQLVLYSDAVSTGGCGGATSAAGPFYCPADSRVYLDLTFYEEMERQLGAPGDFAWAYVIAHEVGHHVQNLPGTNQEVDGLSRDDPDRANELSVRTELQADCYAGVWAATCSPRATSSRATSTRRSPRPRRSATTGSRATPGAASTPTASPTAPRSSAGSWFDKGYDSGDPASCDTFSPDSV